MLVVVENNRTYLHGADPFALHVLGTEMRYPTQMAMVKERGITLPDEATRGWDGWMRLLRVPKRSDPWFPTGLYTMAGRLLDKFQIKYSVDDRRKRAEQGFPEIVNIPLRDYQKEAVKAAVEVGRGVLDMPPRCHAIGEEILTSAGKLIKVEDLKVGDYLLGPDGTERCILEIHTGSDLLYRIKPYWGGNSFVVNQYHELILNKYSRHRTNKGNYCDWNEKIISVRDYVDQSDYAKRTQFLMYSGAVDFSAGNKFDLPIDPYVLGVLLGDGSIIRGTPVVPHEHRATSVYLSQGKNHKKRKNILVDILEKLNLWGCSSGDKFIPWEYLTSSIPNRFELLAGLLDTDGYLANGSFYEFSSKSEKLKDSICFLARSLGLVAKWTEKIVDSVTYYRVNIMGDISNIPIKVARKKAFKNSKWRNLLNTSFSVECLGVDDFIGFTVDKDNRYLNRDFIVLKNSGKTRTMCEIHRQIALPTLWIAPTDRIVTQTFDVLEGFFGRHYATHLVGSKNEGEASRMKVVVCTAATANRLSPDFFKTREMIIVDEWHHSAASTYRDIFNKCEHVYYRYGMTGTFYRSGQDTLAMHSLLSEAIYKITSVELLKRGYLVPTHCVFIPVDAPKLRGVGNTYHLGHGTYGIHENDFRNQLVANAAEYLHRVGRKVLILVGTKKQGRILQRLLSGMLPLATRGAEFQTVEFVSTDVQRPIQKRILESYENDQEVKVLLGTSLLGEGVDLPSTDAIVYARGEKAEVALMQNAYRASTATPVKRNAILVDFGDRHHKKLIDHASQRLGTYWKEATFSVTALNRSVEFPSWVSSLLPKNQVESLM